MDYVPIMAETGNEWNRSFTVSVFVTLVFFETVPIIQSPILAVRLIAGLQIANVHVSPNGFGAAPSS